MLPWSFKFLFGLINDCVPWFGYRRKPYMCLGWGFCAAMLLLLYTMELPDPHPRDSSRRSQGLARPACWSGDPRLRPVCRYYCFDSETRDYVYENGAKVVCNRAAANQVHIPRLLVSASSVLVSSFSMAGRQLRHDHDARRGAPQREPNSQSPDPRAQRAPAADQEIMSSHRTAA